MFTTPTLPTWIHLPNGQLAPFDPDRISQGLFAATSLLGHPDAFLARELTDSILHFLADESAGGIPTLTQVDQVVVKVLRELGQAPLARAYLDQFTATPAATSTLNLAWTRGSPPTLLARQAARAWSREAVFSAELAAAQDEGLITILGQDHPLKLVGAVLGQPGRGGADGALLRALLEAQTVVGEFVALAGLEYLAHALLDQGGRLHDFLADLQLGLRSTGLQAWVALNGAQLPSWAESPASSPLFEPTRELGRFERQGVAEDLLEGLLREAELRQRSWIDWHLAEEDFPAGGQRTSPRLLRVARAALRSKRMSFVFARARRTLALGPGLDRGHPALLLAVAIHLPHVAALPGVGQDEALFLRKLGSVARWCLSAASQKRAFLRQAAREWPELATDMQRGFLLDRARLLVTPVGLDQAIQTLSGHSLCAERPSLDLGRRVLHRLREVLHTEGAPCNLQVCVGGAAPILNGLTWNAEASPTLAVDVTSWSAGVPLSVQLRSAGSLRGSGDQATASLLLPADRHLTPEELVDLLHLALHQTEVERLVLVFPENLRAPRLPGCE